MDANINMGRGGKQSVPNILRPQDVVWSWMLKFIASAQGFSANGLHRRRPTFGHLSLFLMLFGHTCLVKCELMSCCVNAQSIELKCFPFLFRTNWTIVAPLFYLLRFSVSMPAHINLQGSCRKASCSSSRESQMIFKAVMNIQTVLLFTTSNLPWSKSTTGKPKARKREWTLEKKDG